MASIPAEIPGDTSLRSQWPQAGSEGEEGKSRRCLSQASPILAQVLGPPDGLREGYPV